MATRSSILARRIPRTEEPGELKFMGSQSRTRLKQLSKGKQNGFWWISGESLSKFGGMIFQEGRYLMITSLSLEKEMATHSSVLAWRIPGMGSHRVGHDWSDLAAVAVASHVLSCLLHLSPQSTVICIKPSCCPKAFKSSSLSLAQAPKSLPWPWRPAWCQFFHGTKLSSICADCHFCLDYYLTCSLFSQPDINSFFFSFRSNVAFI